MGYWWKDTDTGKPKCSKKILLDAATSATNFTGIGLGLSPRLRGESPATNCLGHGTTPLLISEMLDSIIKSISEILHGLNFLQLKNCLAVALVYAPEGNI
jgi:hypothetical protein